MYIFDPEHVILPPTTFTKRAHRDIIERLFDNATVACEHLMGNEVPISTLRERFEAGVGIVQHISPGAYMLHVSTEEFYQFRSLEEPFPTPEAKLEYKRRYVDEP